MNINRRGYIELYERNERQKERLSQAKDRIEGLKVLRQTKDKILDARKPGIKKAVYKLMYRLLLPYIEQQNALMDNSIDAMELLYGIAEDAIGEKTSLLAWSGFDKREVERQYALEKKRIAMDTTGRKIIQVVSHLNFGDAVGNDVIAIQRALEESGVTTAIYTNYIHKKLPLDIAFYADELPQLDKNDIVIYHFAVKDSLYKKIMKFECKKVIRYHNITPPMFFEPYNYKGVAATSAGLEEIALMKNTFDYGMTDSDFNRQDLIQMGYECPIDVVPILIPFEDYAQEPDDEIINQYQDDWINIIFVGRIAPNKKIEDVINCFDEYKKLNPKSRLLLVGNYDESDLYYNELIDMVMKKKMKDIVFTGHISFSAILAYYRVADVFLCMSEHEGFCVPLVEAMYFEVPIIAFAATAIPETLGDAGILIKDKKPENVAKIMDELIRSREMQHSLKEKAKNRLNNYQYNTVKHQILECVKKVAEQ